MNPLKAGHTVTFAAKVGTTQGGGTPTGKVLFEDGKTILGTSTLNASGVATLTTSTLAAGRHSITAIYKGDVNDAGSTSSPLTENVLYATATRLTSSAHPATTGKPVTFTAKVGTIPAGGVPTGSVLFEDGKTILGAGTLNASGVATLTTSALAAHSHNITAVYVGDANDAGSTSPVLTEVVGSTLTVAVAPTATPSPVTGKTTNLSVLGADTAVPESSLTYTWAATTLPGGATAPSFSANGTNAAKNTTAAFSMAGTYTFTVTIVDPEGLTVKSCARVVVDQTLTRIVVSPSPVTLSPGAKRQFKAVADDQFNNPMATQPAFTWSTTIGTTDQSQAS